MATIAKARDLWTCFADHAPDSSRSLISPHMCASSLQSVRCQNVALARIQLSCHPSTHLVCARPFHQYLHHFLPPNPSTESFYRCLHYLPLPTPSELLHQRLHQIPPTNPSTNTSCFSTTSKSFCLMFRCSLPSRGSCPNSCGAGGWQAQSQSFDGQSRS